MSAVADVLFDAVDERTRQLLDIRRDVGWHRKRGWLVKRTLLLADVLGLTIAFGLSEAVYPGALTLDRVGELAAFLISLPAWIVAAKAYGLYDRDEEQTDHSTSDDFANVFHLVTVCTFALLVISRETGLFSPPLGKLLVYWLLAIVGVPVWRAAARAYCRRQLDYLQNTIVIGAGDVGQDIARKLLKHPEYGMNLVGFVDANPRDLAPDLAHLAILGGPDEVGAVVELLDVERAVVAFSGDPHSEILALIRQIREHDVHVDIVPRLFESLGPSTDIRNIEGVPMIGLPPVRLARSSRVVKRTLDFTVALVMLVMLAPLLGLVALLVRLDSRGSVLYRHQRLGYKGSRLGVLKFRTMFAESCRGSSYGGDSAETEFSRLMANPALREEFELTFKLQNDPRVTRVGRLLRRTSLDELPQLWNVLVGELSLVGPRALTAEEVARYYGDEADTLLDVRPGVTGYWQINGRSHLSYADRVRLDLSYISGWSLRLDVSILMKTFAVLVTGRGAV